MATESSVIPSIPEWQGTSQLHPYFVCDVFTSEPLQGNQVGVFVDGRPFEAEEMQARRPEEIVRLAVKGMMPRNRLARKQLTKLKIYAGPEHPHVAQKPQPLEIEA